MSLISHLVPVVATPSNPGGPSPTASSPSTLVPVLEGPPPGVLDNPLSPSCPSSLSLTEKVDSSAAHNIIYNKIIAGVIIPYSEGISWFKRTHNVSLAQEHSQVVTILFHLGRAIEDYGYSNVMDLARRGDTQMLDFMFITQQAQGPFQKIWPTGWMMFSRMI